MKCQFCHTNEANIYIQEMLGDESSNNINVCSECAAKHNLIENYLNLRDTAKSEHPILKISSKPSKTIEKLECSQCGYQLADYLDTLSLSCPNCYNEFRYAIKKSVKAIHSSSKHKTNLSENYLKAIKKEKKIKKLELKLDNLVREEEYEKAAFVRDSIEKEKKYILERFGV